MRLTDTTLTELTSTRSFGYPCFRSISLKVQPEMRLTGGALLYPHSWTVVVFVLVVGVLVVSTSTIVIWVQFQLER